MTGNIQRIISFLVVVILLIPFLFLVDGASAQVIDVPSSFEDTKNIKYDASVVYHFSKSEYYTEMDITASSNVDFYIFTNSGYNEYIDDSEPYFHPEEDKENSLSFKWSGKLTQDYYLVIDNEYTSESGASPSGSVTCEISVHFSNIRPMNPIQENCMGIVILICAIIGILIVFKLRPKKNVELPPPPVLGTDFCPMCGHEKEKGKPCPLCQNEQEGDKEQFLI